MGCIKIRIGRALHWMLLTMFAVAAIGCGSGGGAASPPPSSPLNLTMLSPDSANTGSSAFEITATGSGFTTSSTVDWNGILLPTNYVSATSLTATVPATDLAAVGTAAVTISNPLIGATSKGVQFTINAAVPTIASLAPSALMAGGSAFQLVITGTNFSPSAIVLWDGRPVPTTFDSDTRLIAQVTAAQIASVATISVAVENDASAKETSNVATFIVSAAPPLPTITTLAPSTLMAGGAAFQLVITGTNFSPSAIVLWSGRPVPTTFDSNTRLTAQVTAAQIASVGTVPIVVESEASAGKMSNVATFTVSAEPPLPTIGTLAPSALVAGGAAFQLVVTGTNFSPSAIVLWDGRPIPTTFDSSTRLTAQVTAAQIASVGTVPIVVESEASAGKTSNVATFTVSAETPLPTITTLAPSALVAGGAAFQLVVTGTNFTSSAIVLWNGRALPTAFNSSTQLSAQVTAPQIASVATIPVTVETQASAGGTSNVATFSVYAGPPLPTITTLAPSALMAGGAAFQLVVTGTNFTPSAIVLWDGRAIPTAFDSATQLTATVTAAQIASVGTVPVTVESQASAGETSNVATFTVSAGLPLPTITTLAPSALMAGGAAFQLVVTGTNFTPSAIVLWDGRAIPTVFNSTTQLTASVAASQIASVASIPITVESQASAGETSNVATFTVSAAPPLPTIATLAPSTLTAGGAAFQLVVTGTNFTPTAIVLWSGRAIPTSFDSSTQLTAQVTAAQIATATTISVSVESEATSGVTSNVSTFTVLSQPPILTSISPNSVPAYSAGVTVTITGTGFTAKTLVSENSGLLQPTTVSPTTITLANMSFPYSSGSTVFFAVEDPASGYVNSNTLTLAITQPIPAPTSVAPATVLAGQGALAVTVTGQYFTSASVVYLNGSARPTTLNTSGQLVAQLTAQDVATAGTATITIEDTASGNVPSNPISLIIQAWPPLSLTSLSPATVPAGNGAFTLTVLGNGFSTNSIIKWNGVSLPTSYISGSTLRASVTAAQVGSVGTISIAVVNPTDQGGISAPLPLTIVAPSIDAVSYQINNGHSGSINFKSATLPAAASWSVNIGGAPSNALIVAGRVYVLANTSAVAGSQLLALDATTGAILWGPIEFGGPAGITYDAGTIFVSSNPGLLAAIDATTGTRKWTISYFLEGAPPPSPVAGQGIVYMPGYFSVVAFSEANGAQLWQEEVYTGSNGPLALTVDGVYVSGPCTTFDLQPSSGTVIWTANTGCSGGDGVPPVVASGTVYSPLGPAGTYSMYSGIVYTSETGTVLGSFSASAAPAISASSAYILNNSTLQGLALSNNQVEWSFAGDGQLVTAPIVVNSFVFIGSSSGNLYALDATTAALLWTQNLGAPIPGPPAFGSNLVSTTGLTAGDGVLIVPAGNTVTAYVLSTNP